DAEFQGVLQRAVIVAALALLALLGLRAADAIARLGLALAHALLVIAVAQSEAVMLQHLDRHAHGAGTAAQHIGTGNDLRQVLAYCIAYLFVVTEPVARAA